MWTTLALLTALGAAPAQRELTLAHVRSTHGLLGPERRDETLAPGDILFVCFDIRGIRVDEEGKVRYSMALELSDSDGKSVFRQQPKDTEVRTSLGGNTVPAYARLNVGLDTPSGDYQLKITVKDLASSAEQSLTRDLKVLPKDFALVRTSATLDVDAQYPAGVFLCGQGVWVHCSAVGFQRRGKQPNVVFEMVVRDPMGRPTVARPTVGNVNKDVPAELAGLPMAFPLTLNRPGKFTVELQATDQVSGKKARTSFPITVQSGPPQR
jgi:hypothetical protein